MEKKLHRLRSLGLLLAAVLAAATPSLLRALPPAGARTAQGQASAESGPAQDRRDDYSLPPQIRAKAIEYSRVRYAMYFADVAFSFAIFLALWVGRVGVRFRNWARRVSPRRFLQTALFVPMFLATVSLLTFPLDYFSGFVVEHRFGLSTEALLPWLADWAKSFAVSAAFLVFLIGFLYIIIRRSPRRWWLYFWLFTIPVSLGVILLQPLIIDPLYFKFTPLENTQPAMTDRIEAMLGRAGLQIPRGRIFEMNASSKTTTINAYVTGIGASKRLVIWDNTLEKLTPDEALLVVGHETGHYVLGHIPKEFALIEAVSLAFILAGYVMVERLVARWGPRTGLEGTSDLASLPVLFLVLTVITFMASPAICAISRHFEHQADQYGLELAHGIVSDPNQADAKAFLVLGEEDLSDPDPSPIIKFWLYTHPPLEDRIRFALRYKPWAEGKPLQLVHPRN